MSFAAANNARIHERSLLEFSWEGVGRFSGSHLGGTHHEPSGKKLFKSRIRIDTLHVRCLSYVNFSGWYGNRKRPHVHFDDREATKSMTKLVSLRGHGNNLVVLAFVGHCQDVHAQFVLVGPYCNQ